MKLDIRQIAEAFSTGNFQSTYPYLAGDIKWEIAGDRILQGKDEVITFCDNTAKYFEEVSTNFKTSNVIFGNDKIAINGTAEFTNKENKITRVLACDIYQFKDGILKEITSYCILTEKNI